MSDVEGIRKDLLRRLRKTIDDLGPRGVVHGSLGIPNEMLSDPEASSRLIHNILGQVKGQWISPATLVFKTADLGASPTDNPGFTRIEWTGIGYKAIQHD